MPSLFAASTSSPCIPDDRASASLPDTEDSARDLQRVVIIRRLNDEWASCIAHRVLLLHTIANIHPVLGNNENEAYLGGRSIRHLRGLLHSADARLECVLYLQGVVERALHHLGEPLEENSSHVVKKLFKHIGVQTNQSTTPPFPMPRCHPARRGSSLRKGTGVYKCCRTYYTGRQTGGNLERKL